MSKTIKWATIIVMAALLQGCQTGHKILTEIPIVNPEDAGLGEVIVGIRMGVIDGYISSYSELYLATEFAKRIEEAKLFKQAHYPIDGTESVILEIGATTPKHKETAGEITKDVFCGLTLLLACIPITADYKFRVEVRAIGWPVSRPIGHYQANGLARVQFGFSAFEGVEKGKSIALTAALTQIINGIKQDRLKYLPSPPAK